MRNPRAPSLSPSSISLATCVALAAALTGCGGKQAARPSPSAAPVPVCGQPSQEAFVEALQALGSSHDTESWEAELGPCHASMSVGYVEVTEGGRPVYAAKEAGAARAWHPAFAVEGVRVGMDAAEAGRQVAALGFTVVRCVDDGEAWACAFDRPTPGEGCDNDELGFSVARDPAQDPAAVATPEALAGKAITGIVLVMPC